MPSPLQLLLLAPILLGAAPPQAEPAANPPAQAGPQDPRLATASAFTLPLYLQDLPPEIRSARVIHLVHKDVPGVARNVTRSREEALELAQHITALLGAGEDFEKLCREYSAAKNAVGGGVLGSFPPGLLAPPMDDFLFSAEVGEVSAPIEAENGIHVMQRIERRPRSSASASRPARTSASSRSPTPRTPTARRTAGSSRCSSAAPTTGCSRRRRSRPGSVRPSVAR